MIESVTLTSTVAYAVIRLWVQRVPPGLDEASYYVVRYWDLGATADALIGSPPRTDYLRTRRNPL